MKRSGPIQRKTELRRRSPMQTNADPHRLPSPARKPKPRARRPGVLSETATQVLLRDVSCRAWSMGFGLDLLCDGRGHIHHRVLRSQGGTHTADNLLYLCRAHHELAHDHRRAEAEATGVIIRKATP